MSEKFEQYLNKNDKYLLACSYGTDSMVLLYLLRKYNYNFEVAFVNYRLRPESDEEEEDIKAFCEKEHIILRVLEVEKNSIKGNLEASCRSIRYAFFLRLNEQYHYSALLVAHHQDDSIETYLLQKERGGLVDHYGLKVTGYYQNLKVIRPLLDYPKTELTQILETNNIPHCVDKSNSDLKYRRNRIRHGVVHQLSEKQRQQLLTEMETRNDELEQLKYTLSQIDIHKVDELLKLGEEERQYALFMLIEEAGITYSLSKENAENIYKALESPKPNVTIKIGEFYFEKSYGEVRFYIKGPAQTYKLVVDSPKVLDTKYFYFDLTKQDKFKVGPKDWPLTIRNASPNDVVKINDYTVKVSRLFIDWKVPLKYRETWPIILNKKGEVLYIPHYQKEFKKSDSSDFFVKLG